MARIISYSALALLLVLIGAALLDAAVYMALGLLWPRMTGSLALLAMIGLAANAIFAILFALRASDRALDALDANREHKKGPR